MVAPLVPIYALQYASGIVTYYQFILEETLQSGLMGCYIAANAGHIGLMDKVIDRLEKVTIPKLENYNKKWGFLAFYNKGSFDAFIKAGKLAVDVYKKSGEEEELIPKQAKASYTPLELKGRMQVSQKPVYINDPITFSVLYACTINLSTESDALDLVWLINGEEVLCEMRKGAPRQEEKGISLNKTFTTLGEYKIECIVCKPKTHGMPEDELLQTIYPKLDPNSPIMFISKIKRKPDPACVGDVVTFTTRFKAVKHSTLPTKEALFIWYVNNEEEKRENLFARALEEETEINFTTSLPTIEKFKIECKAYKPALTPNEVWHNRYTTITPKPISQCVAFTDRITREPTPTYAGDLIKFCATFACTRESDTQTKTLALVWTVEEEIIKTDYLTAPPYMDERTTKIEKVFKTTGKYNITCTIMTYNDPVCKAIDSSSFTFTVLPLMASVKFMDSISRDPKPANVNDLITFSIPFASSRDIGAATETMNLIWLIDEEEEKVEPLTAPAHMGERTTTMEKNISEPGIHKIECLILNPEDPEAKPIDTASLTLTVNPLLAAVNFIGSISKEPSPAYVKESINFSVPFANSEDIPEYTEVMELTWFVNEEAWVEEELSAPPHMAEETTSMSTTLGTPGVYKIKCVMTNKADPEAPPLDTVSTTITLKPLMAAVDFIGGIGRDPKPSYVNEEITFSIPFANSRDIAETTEIMDIVWEINEEVKKTEQLAAKVNMQETLVELKETFTTPGEYKIKCKLQHPDDPEAAPFDTTSLTVTIKPLMAAVDFIGTIQKEPIPAYIHDPITFSIPFANSRDIAEATEIMDVVWLIDEAEKKIDELTAPSTMEQIITSLCETFTEPGSYNIQCELRNPEDPEAAPIDSASSTLTVKPLMAAVEFKSGIQREPTPAYINDPVTFSIPFANSRDITYPTEVMELVWLIEEGEVKKDEHAAPPYMEEVTTSMNHIFTSPGKYSIKCICQATYLGEMHIIDTASYTVTIKEL